MPDFMPRQDADLLAWLKIFSARIAVEYAELGLTLDDAERLAADTEAFALAFSRAKNPSTDSSTATVVKNDARKRAKDFARGVARVVRSQFDIAPERLVCLGIKPAKKTRTPVSRPSAAPRVQLIQKNSGIVLQLRDPDAPGSRRMPKNHTAMIFQFIGPTPPPCPSQAAAGPGWTHVRGSSSMRQRITLPTTVPPTETVWLVARFRTSAGHGPASRPVSMLACQFDREMPQRVLEAA